MTATVDIFGDQPLVGVAPQTLSGVARDSRLVREGDAFIAIGDRDAVAAHSSDAVQRGAAVIISEEAVSCEGAAHLRTPHARWSYAVASARWHGIERVRCPLVAVTGTAGKSTTVHHAWWALGNGAARCGTISWHDGRSERPAAQTTPPPEELFKFLCDLPDACPGVAMELSSHAGDQYRAAGIPLAGLVYTGLGHDHLEYHHTRAAYLSAKLNLVRQLIPGALCIINADDATAHVVAHAAHGVGAHTVLLGIKRGESRVVKMSETWRLRHLGVDYHLPTKLPGDFNAWNAAAGALLASAAGVPLKHAMERLATVPPVPGRLELLAQRPQTYVDYAHTPDELATMLTAVRREFPHRRLVCVFGCGGDRDRSKRGPMGHAALIADQAVLTTDNCRSEDPRRIADDVVAGLPHGTDTFWAKGDELDSGRWLGELIPSFGAPAQRVQDAPRSVVIELNRGMAIRLARALAGPDGVVVVAGKGHETTQSVAGTVHEWDDRAFVRSLEGGV